MTYQYTLAGGLTVETYPSGRIVHHNFAVDGKEAATASRAAVNRPFKSHAQNFSYNAAGAVTDMQLGNMRWESTAFNSRLQPTSIALGTSKAATDMLHLDYTYNPSGYADQNNGNVISQTISVPDVGTYHGFVAVQSYTYDELNRLKSATENSTPNGGGSSSQSWKQTYLFDRFGNRTFDTSSGATTTLPSGFNAHIYNPTINPANNQFPTDQDYIYDAAGNVTQDATGKKFAHDGENKQTSFGTGGSSINGGTYVYDGDGKRIKKIVGTEVTVFVYDAAGQMVAEYVTTGPTSPQVIYLTADTLGTPRTNTDAAGNLVARHDYLPFGEEIGNDTCRTLSLSYGADNIRMTFADYERDAESSLDYVRARYYDSSHGRFTGRDPIIISEDRMYDPQTLNGYSYVLNNPLIFSDPTGETLYSLDKQTDENIKRMAPGTKIDADGEVHKAGLLHRIWNHLSGHGGGTALITQLVDSQKVTAAGYIPGLDNGITIDMAADKAEPQSPFLKSSSTQLEEALEKQTDERKLPTKVDYLVGSGGSVSTYDRQEDGSMLQEHLDSAAALGHELIHATHWINGTYDGTMGTHDFTNGGVTYTESNKKEEFRTSGLAYNSAGDITENKLRKELGVQHMRATYNNPNKWSIKR